MNKNSELLFICLLVPEAASENLRLMDLCLPGTLKDDLVHALLAALCGWSAVFCAPWLIVTSLQHLLRLHSHSVSAHVTFLLCESPSFYIEFGLHMNIK